jgi:hypothetical protein
MKILCSLFLVPALFFAAPAARAQQMSFEQLESNFDAAVLELRTTVILDRAPSFALQNIQAAFAERNRAAEPLFPQAQSARARLRAVIEGLYQRAARWQLYFEDIEHFVEEVVEARMQEELSALDELVASGQLTSRLRYNYRVSLIRRIAARTIELVQAPNLRPRLAALIAGLLDATDQNVLIPAHVQRLRAFMAAANVERSFQRIERRIAAGTLIPLDLVLHKQRVRALPIGMPRQVVGHP